MGEKHDIIQIAEGIRYLRFILVNVKPGPGEAPVFQNLCQCCLINYLSSGGIDQIGMAGHQRETIS